MPIIPVIISVSQYSYLIHFLRQMERLKEEMAKLNFDPKTHWAWQEEESLEELIINLNELKSSLETEITQSMTSHLLGKDRTLNMI